MTRFLLAGLLVATMMASGTAQAEQPVKVFVLAGDESVLRIGSIDGTRPTQPGWKRSDSLEPDGIPGAFLNVVKADKRFTFLGKPEHAARKDVALYDAHPLTNNTRRPARLLQIPTAPKDPLGYGVGIEQMFGRVVGERFEEPVLLIRFAAVNPLFFSHGSRSLGYDFLPPSAGGGLDLDGGWDVIHFNHGVWDQQYVDPKNPNKSAEPGKGVIRTSAEDYEKNLRAIVAQLKKTKATLIWASTTPILEGSPPAYVGGKMVDRYNAIAEKVMKENGILIDDLNAECVRLGKPKARNVHDVGDLAPKVTETILATIKERKNPSRPMPRVLFIGDSITGSYWAKVRQNLDGKAFVAKNPGNGEHSGTGARLVGKWIDHKQYLLNGQEYLELATSVKQVMSDVDRFCPDFAKRKPELAGLVWFQGIADAQSNAFAAGYEKHLAALIRDLRAEFKAPKLPVVVVALGQHGKKMTPNAQKVHDAQMAAGNPKHTAFAGNVASVDTVPFFFPAQESPGGYEWLYRNNARSFLLIGQAAGTEMLRLHEAVKDRPQHRKGNP